MAYTPDDIFYSSMEMDILHEELKRKEKFKKSKKNKDEDTIFDHLTFESGIFLGIFLGMVIGMVMTLVIVVIMIKLF